MASVDEPTVRDKAVESIYGLVVQMKYVSTLIAAFVLRDGADL